MESATADSHHLMPQDYLEYQVAVQMFPIQTICFLVLGTAGNLISLVGFSTRELRRSSSSVYLRCLAVFDTLILWAYLCLMINRVYEPSMVHPVYCKTISFFTNVVSSLSGWTVVSMTVERYLAIRWPLHVSTLVTKSKAVVIMMVLCLVNVGFNLHFFWTTGMVYRKSSKLTLCGIISDHVGFHRVWSYVDSTFVIFLPITVVFVFNNLIIYSIYKSRRTQWHSSEAARNCCPNEEMTSLRSAQRHQRCERQSRQITVMLMSVSVAYLFLVTPSAVSYVMLSFRYFDIRDSHQYAKAFLFQQVCIMLLMCNHSINGVLYSFTGNSFRTEVRAVFCDRKLRDHRLATRTISSRLPSMHSLRSHGTIMKTINEN